MSEALPATAAFDEAAEAYDGQSNPVLSLEQRFLPALFPHLRGLRVLDVGCGTGRWLQHFANAGAAEITGVDASPRMLDVARRRMPRQVRLHYGDARALPVAEWSADLVLLSFALSYCESLRDVAFELKRVTKDDASIFIADLHPATERRFGWKRTFRAERGSVSPRHVRHELEDVVAAMAEAGFRLACRIEPEFAAPEAQIFAENGMSAAFEALRGFPAIYITQFVKTPARPSYSLSGGAVAFGASARSSANLAIAENTIFRVTSQAERNDAGRIDASGWLILPGLINSHDHLEFGLYPNLGRGPYKSCREWADDIHRVHRELIASHERVPKRVRLYWGALRNLLHGVTTVCHHNPYDDLFRNPQFPVRVLENMAWAHSLGFDPAACESFASSSREAPFVIHAGEGTDASSANEVAELGRLGLLDDRTVLVHALNISEGDCALINRRGTAVVTCPTSNLFLYQNAMSPSAVRSLQRVALGTDSPLTARGGMLDEIEIAAQALELNSSQIYEMCTLQPASMLRLRGGEGTIRPDGAADLLCVRDNSTAPADRLRTLTIGDIELVLVRGRVHLASDDALRRLSTAQCEGLFPLSVDDRLVRWVRAPLPELFAAVKDQFGDEVVIGSRRLTYVG